MSIFKTYSPEQLDNHFSLFLVNSWSYSKVSTFSRNQKAFEMSYIYGYDTKLSSTTIAGQAYHKSLDAFFTTLKDEKKELDLVDLETIAFEYIEDIEANKWKIQKTTPTIADCKIKATKTVQALLKFFLKEKAVYLDDIEEILDVELSLHEFVTLNGVDIPLPCNARIDLVVKTKGGKIAIIDHKSKNSFSSEDELKLTIGIQAISYVKVYESNTSIAVDEVWFVEAKYSENRDKSAQLNCYKVDFGEDERRLYEALLYEPLRAVIQAVNNPDYVYIINDSDNFIDKAEMYDFWAKTMSAEVEDFNVDPSKYELIKTRLKKIRDVEIATVNPKMIKEFRKNASQFIQYDLSNKDMTQEEKIEHVLRTFGAITKVAHIFDGYSSNTYLLEVSAGVKVTSIQSHKLDLANALNVSNVRIPKDLVVYEGKSYVAIEFAKKRTKDLLFNKKELVDLKIPIGRDNLDNNVYWDLNNHSTPHALVCGATGSGKSVALKSIVEYMKLAKIKDITILDPKYEFSQMNIPGVKVISDILDIEKFMSDAVEEMNKRVKKGGNHPFKCIIFDEFADAQAQARSGKELNIYEEQEAGTYKLSAAAILAGVPPQKKYKTVLVGQLKSLEENLRILAQKGRSVNFRMLAATQRASVKIITGDTKANFPVQICFRVPKEVDSKVVIDESGAESLAGYGDGLIRSPEYPELVRFQAYYKP